MESGFDVIIHILIETCVYLLLIHMVCYLTLRISLSPLEHVGVL